MAQVLLVGLAIAIVGAAVTPMIIGEYKGLRVIIALVVAFLLAVAAGIWELLPAPAPGSIRAAVEAAANDFRWWFAIVAAVWIYSAVMNVLTEIRRNNEILSLRNDVQSIARVIERGVLPRHLNKGQQATISGFLSLCQPYRVSFKVIARDEEASGYRADLQQALTKGGWTIGKIEYSDDLQEGIRTHLMRTMPHQQQPDDPKNPTPDRLLVMALGLAGVRFEGSSGGSGVIVTEDSLTIEIGRRRKDTYTVDPPLGFPY